MSSPLAAGALALCLSAGLLLAGAGCSDSDPQQGPGGAGAAGGGGGASSSSGGMGGDGSGGDTFVGSGGSGGCDFSAQTVSLKLDDEDVSYAEVLSLWYAPNTNFSFCFSQVPGATACDTELTISPGEEPVLDMPIAASAQTDSGWTSAAGFTLTLTNWGPPFAASFTGTMDDNGTQRPIEGSFEGCLLATE